MEAPSGPECCLSPDCTCVCVCVCVAYFGDIKPIALLEGTPECIFRMLVYLGLYVREHEFTGARSQGRASVTR